MSRLTEHSSLPGPSASTSQEGLESCPSSASNRTLRVTLLSSEWRSTKGGFSTINRELAIQLAKHPNVEVCMYLPRCSEEDKRAAARHKVCLIEAEEMPGYDPVDWLATIPKDHVMDCVIGHGVHLGRQVPHIKRVHGNCKWVQLVHTDPEELGMFKSYANPISKGEKKHQAEVKLCKLADQVVAVGSKLAEAFAAYLRSSGKDQDVFNLTPSIFTEFMDVTQAAEERKTFRVLVFGRGDNEDFWLKGYDIAAKAIAELKDMPQAYKLVFVGAPVGEEEKVKELLLKEGIERSQLIVRHFDESREHLAELFCEVDLAIMPSRTEGFGLAAVEALSAGLPVLVSGNSGFGEALQKVLHGSNSVVNSEDPKKWAEAIKKVCNRERGLRLEEATDLRVKYEQKYSWQGQCDTLIERMLNMTQGATSNQEDVKERHMAIHASEEGPSHLMGLQADSSDKQVSGQVKRVLSPSETPAPKQCKMLTIGPKDSSDKQVSGQVKRVLSPSETPAPKQCKMLTIGPKDSSDKQVSGQVKRVLSPSETPAPKQCKMLTIGPKGLSKAQASESAKRPSSSIDDSSPKKPKMLTGDSEGWDIATLVKLLKTLYRRRSQLRPLIADSNIQLELEKVYTRLKIISRPKADDPSSGKEVNVYEIFGKYEKREDVVALAEGSPGKGKTTLCLKLAYDWAVESVTTAIAFSKFVLVLLLKCRDIDGDIMEAISEQLLPEDISEERRKTVLDFIKDIHNQERILIILDGLDELPQKSKYHVGKLLDRRILPFCYVFVTSRQERGIEVRKNFKFDILLEIKGFTESDACEYIRKHFKQIGPDLSSKGEKLIEEIKENTFLHALRNNPLNLLLLCVIYEDYEGKLPSSPTELYQVIVQCLLRRYCAKHDMNAPDQDKDLEKQFEKDILALGKLAWNCLLQYRHSFREDELKEMEKRNENLVARRLGLLYKEESLKRLKPQHEYYFLHKTFQEYLAACYIAHKLRRKTFNVFEDLTFDNLVEGYPQVFLFVSGLLGEEASLLFEQIGKELEGHWDWEQCSEESAEFFVNCFSESENGEQIAGTLCSFIPFPLDVHLEISEDLPYSFARVLEACKRFSNLQTPVNLSCTVDDFGLAAHIFDLLDSCKQLKTFSITCKYKFEELANDLFRSLATSTSLSQLTLDVNESIFSDTAAMIESHLTKIKSLTQVALTFPGIFGTAWLSVLGTGLSAHTPLTSVLLTVCGPMNETAIQALEKLLSNESLTSLSFTFRGDMQDLLAAALSRGLAGKICIRSLDLCIDGKLSYYGAKLLERGLLENRSLNDLKVLLHGERPENWCSVVEKVRLAKKSQVSFVFYTDTFSKVTANQVAHFRPFVVDKGVCPNQHLTVNVCGELTIEGADALCEVLCPSFSRLTINLYGKLTDGFSHLSTRCNDLPKTPSSVTVNIWGKLTEEEKTLSQDINPAIIVNVHDVSIPQDDSSNNVNVTISNPASLATLVTEVKNTTKEKLSVLINNREVAFGEDSSLKELALTINNETFKSEEWSTAQWDRGLGDGLKCNTSLRELTLTVNQYGFTGGWWGTGLGDGLKCNTSIRELTLTVNQYDYSDGEWGMGLGDGLKCNTSIRELTLTINQYDYFGGEWGRGLGDGLKCNTSIRELTLTVNEYGFTGGEWGMGLGDGLKCNTSLRELTLTVYEYGFAGGEWGMGLGDGSKCNTSLRELILTINQDGFTGGWWGRGLGDGLKCNTSLRELTLTVNQYGFTGGEWGRGLGDGLKCNTSIRELTLTVNQYDYSDGEWGMGLGDGLKCNTSIRELTLTVNQYGYSDGEWGRGLGDGLKCNTSIRELTLTVNQYGFTGGEWGMGLGDGLKCNTSIRELTLTINWYSGESLRFAAPFFHGFGNNRSVRALTLTINNYEFLSGFELEAVGEGLAISKSLTSCNLVFNMHGKVKDDYLLKFCEHLMRSESLTTLTLQVNDQHLSNGSRNYDLSQVLVKSRSLSSIDLTVSFYGTETSTSDTSDTAE